MNHKQFPFQESLTFAWNSFREHFATLVMCFLITAIAYSITSMISVLLAGFLVAGLFGGTLLTGNPLPFIIVGALAALVLLVAPSILSMGITRGFFRVAFDLYHQKTTTVSRTFSELTLKKSLSFLFLFLLLAAIVATGFALFILPGVIFLSRFYYAPFILVDRNKGILNAFRTSWQITRGHTWMNLLFVALVVLICSIPLVGMPLCLLTSVYAYEKLKKQDMPHLYVQQ